MKRYRTKILCRGCKGEQDMSFDARSKFEPIRSEIECTLCGSTLEVWVKQGMLKRQLLTKCNLLKHTQKLLDILDAKVVSA